MSVSFNDCFDIVNGMIPKNLRSNEEYVVLLKLLAYSIFKLYENMERIDNAYSVDGAFDEELPKIADTLGIIYPIGANADRLRLLLKYYGKIINNRGTIYSIKQLARILEMDEPDIYNISLDDYSNVLVEEIYDGFILIKCDNITDFEFANIMLRKVVPAGYRFAVMNRNGPVVLGFERGAVGENVLVGILGFDEIVSNETASIVIE